MQLEKTKEFDNDFENENILSQTVYAGKRLYHFDVKATINNDYFLLITESRKCYNKNGQKFYLKNKIFLYKEDFEKFTDTLAEMLGFIFENNPATNSQFEDEAEQIECKEYAK